LNFSFILPEMSEKPKYPKPNIKSVVNKQQATPPSAAGATSTTSEPINQNLIEFLKNPLELASEIDPNELEAHVQNLRSAYYNHQSLVSDQIYDQLEEILKQRKADSLLLKATGAPVEKSSFEADKQKVKLPYWMGSMDKVKPDSQALENWLTKNPGAYQISHKLDGISALLILNPLRVCPKDKSVCLPTNRLVADQLNFQMKVPQEELNSTAPNKLYTRGNGIVGQDISHLIEYLNFGTIGTVSEVQAISAKSTITDVTSVCIRGEIILSKANWQKYQSECSNARNMAAGLINAKHPVTSQLRDLEFVAYELIEPAGLSPSQQFQWLTKHNFKVVSNHRRDQVDSAWLSDWFKQARVTSDYQIDGLIVTQDQPNQRNLSGNPKYSVAFKLNAEGQLTTVRAVIWSASRHGFLKPRIEIDPITITDEEGGTVTVQFCTAFNAKYVVDNKIGPGCRVKIVRSGDVIPYITEVVEPAPGGAQMPSTEVKYQWNSTGIDIILVNNQSDPAVLIEGLIYFFKTMETKFVSQATITKLVTSGKTTIPAILGITIAELAALPGLGQKSAERVRESLDGVLKNVEEERLMAASGVFGHGMGSRKLRVILKTYADFGSWPCGWTVRETGNFSTPDTNVIQRTDFQDMIKKIVELEGFQDKTAYKVVYHLPNYQAFLKGLPPIEWKTVVASPGQEATSAASPGQEASPGQKAGAEMEAGAEVEEETGAVVPTKPPASIWLNQKVVFSGFRDKELEQKIMAGGGQVTTSVTGQTTLVLVSDLTVSSSKIEKANSLGISVKMKPKEV